MGRFWGTASLVIIGILTPLTLVIAVSQNAVPGDLFYPVKRGIEGVVLAAASVNPTTKVLFKTDLSGRRFIEAYKLLARADTSGLDSFIREVETTQATIVTIADPKQKQELQTKLVAKINEYQVTLARVQTPPTPPRVQQPADIPTQSPIQVITTVPTIPAPPIPVVVSANPIVQQAISQTQDRLDKIKKEIEEKEKKEKKEREERDHDNKGKKKKKGD